MLQVCCWPASRFSTAQELRLGKRAERKCGCASARSHGQFRHTCHTRVKLENQRVLLAKHTHTCTPGTQIRVHLRHADVFTWNTHVFTWNTMKRGSNSGTPVCTRGTHVCSPGTQTRAIKAYMCVHVGHTHVYHWNTNMCPGTPRVRLKHTCVHTWNTHNTCTREQT